MKGFSSLEQSKKLAEFLPLESADMFWLVLGNTPRVHVLTEPLSNYSRWESYPCWSLAALLDIIPYPTLGKHVDETWSCASWVEKVKPYFVESCDSPINACYEMIIKLHEQKLL